MSIEGQELKNGTTEFDAVIKIIHGRRADYNLGGIKISKLALSKVTKMPDGYCVTLPNNVEIFIPVGKVGDCEDREFGQPVNITEL